MPYTASLDLLNGIRASASTAYADLIPLATRDNITNIGNSLLTYSTAKEYFFNTIANKIAQTVIRPNKAIDKFAKFKGEQIPYGDTLEDIYVDFIDEQAFDDTNTNPHEQFRPSVNVEYHKIDRRRQFIMTISDDAIRSAFRSAEGVDSLIMELMNTLEQTVIKHDFVLGKELLASYSAKYATQEITEITESNISTAGKDLMKAIKVAINDMGFLTDVFNYRSREVIKDKSELTLFLNKDIRAKLEVDLFANEFNFEQNLPNVDIIELDDFGSMGDTYAVLISNDAMILRDQLNNTEQLRNPRAMTTNIFKNIWGLGSMRQHENAVLFKKQVV